MKYLKTYNEKLGDKLNAPSDEEVLSKLKNLSTEKILEESLKNNFKAGIKYVLDNRKKELNKNIIYILEKYFLGEHQNEEIEFETWFKEQLTNLKTIPSKKNNNIIIYKKDNEILYKYNISNNNLSINIDICFTFLEKFNINIILFNLITKYMVKKYLNLKINKIKNYIPYDYINKNDLKIFNNYKHCKHLNFLKDKNFNFYDLTNEQIKNILTFVSKNDILEYLNYILTDVVFLNPKTTKEIKINRKIGNILENKFKEYIDIIYSCCCDDD